MSEQLHDKATQTGFARIVGASQQAISQKCKSGLLVKGATNAEWLISYIESLREEAAGRSEKGLSVVRERETLASAQLKELDLAERLKLIINIPDIEPLLIHLMKDIQAQIIAAGNRAMQAVEAEHGITLNDEIILQPLRAALGNVAGSADQFNSGLTGKPSASVSAAADGNSGVDRKKHKAAIRK